MRVVKGGGFVEEGSDFDFDGILILSDFFVDGVKLF